MMDDRARHPVEWESGRAARERKRDLWDGPLYEMGIVGHYRRQAWRAGWEWQDQRERDKCKSK